MLWIVLAVIIIWVAYRLLRPSKNWRNYAVKQVALWLKFVDEYKDEKKAFLHVLELSYDSPEIHSQLKNTEYYDKLRTRMIAVLYHHGFEGYIKSKEYQPNPRLEKIYSQISDEIDKGVYVFSPDDYTPPELIYCIQVIQYPRVVKNIRKKDAMMVIDNFIKIANSRIMGIYAHTISSRH